MDSTDVVDLCRWPIALSIGLGWAGLEVQAGQCPAPAGAAAATLVYLFMEAHDIFNGLPTRALRPSARGHSWSDTAQEAKDRSVVFGRIPSGHTLPLPSFFKDDHHCPAAVAPLSWVCIQCGRSRWCRSWRVAQRPPGKLQYGRRGGGAGGGGGRASSIGTGSGLPRERGHSATGVAGAVETRVTGHNLRFKRQRKAKKKAKKRHKKKQTHHTKKTSTAAHPATREQWEVNVARMGGGGGPSRETPLATPASPVRLSAALPPLAPPHPGRDPR